MPVTTSELALRFLLGFANAFLAGLNYWQYTTYHGDKTIRTTFAVQCFMNICSAFYLIVGMAL